jgi:hypothetical protein
MSLLRVALLAAGALACGDDEPGACFFDGRYEIGFISYNGCGDLSEQVIGNGEQDECSTQETFAALDGSERMVYLSCRAGDPVVDCEGFMHGSDGCRWDVYMRRIAQ